MKIELTDIDCRTNGEELAFVFEFADSKFSESQRVAVAFSRRSTPRQLTAAFRKMIRGIEIAETRIRKAVRDL